MNAILYNSRTLSSLASINSRHMGLYLLTETYHKMADGLREVNTHIASVAASIIYDKLLGIWAYNGSTLYFHSELKPKEGEEFSEWLERTLFYQSQFGDKDTLEGKGEEVLGNKPGLFFIDDDISSVLLMAEETGCSAIVVEVLGNKLSELGLGISTADVPRIADVNYVYRL